MESFSTHHSTFLLDSTFLPNTPTALSCLLEGEDLNTSSVSYYPSQPLQEIPFKVRIQENNYLDNSTKSLSSDNEPPVTNKNKADSSSMVLELENGDQASQKEIPIQKKRKNKYGSCLSSVKSQVAKEAKAKKQKKSSSRKETEEMERRANEKQQSNVPEEASNSYIHVRARRGEATDNHSLAERVRREKISVRMKLLEDLVPGCDKVVGKAHILDNIINYVQTLQCQVEFLSMKLASLNSMSYEFAADLDPFMVKSEKLSSLASSLPSMHQFSPPHPIDFTDTTTTLTTRNNYSLVDNSISFLYQQGQRTNTFSQFIRRFRSNIYNNNQRMNPKKST